MNWLLIVVVLFLAAYVCRGYHNGFIKTVFSIFAVLIALVITTVGSPILSKTLQNNEQIYSAIEEKVGDALKIDEKISGRVDQVKAIENLALPESIRNALVEHNYDTMYETLEVSSFGDYVSGYITCMILNAISYIVVFIIALVLVRIVANILDIISKLPILNSINKIGGLCVGLVHGLIILWVLCVVLTIFSSTEIGKVLYEQINSSVLLSFIYNNNWFMHILTGVAKTILLIS